MLKSYVFPPEKAFSDATPSFDIKSDFKFVYTAILKSFHIDIIDDMSKISWKKFQMLLKDVGEDCFLNYVIKIREEPLPLPTKENMEKRTQLRRLKMKYDLPYLKRMREKQKRETLRKMAKEQKRTVE